MPVTFNFLYNVPFKKMETQQCYCPLAVNNKMTIMAMTILFFILHLGFIPTDQIHSWESSKKDLTSRAPNQGEVDRQDNSINSKALR